MLNVYFSIWNAFFYDHCDEDLYSDYVACKLWDILIYINVYEIAFPQCIIIERKILVINFKSPFETCQFRHKFAFMKTPSLGHEVAIFVYVCKVCMCDWLLFIFKSILSKFKCQFWFWKFVISVLAEIINNTK